MKTLLITGALCATLGATAGWLNASDYYEAKALKEQVAYFEAVTEVAKRAENYQKISEEYYADYQNAINREPTVVTERVLVRANCPTNAAADTTREVGNGAATTRAELQQETVGNLTALANKWESDLLKCKAQHQSLLNKIRAHNGAN